MESVVKFFQRGFVTSSLLAIITILYAYTIFNHEVFGEWDALMHYFSGKNLLEHGVYAGWASYFWPPLQPLILALGEPFIIGKIVSVVSALFTLIALFFISDFYLKNHLKSMVLIVYVFSTALFFEVFTVVENHSLETAFFMLGYLTFLHADRLSSIKLFLACGVLVAIASLSRYTSYALALSLVLILLIKSFSFSSIKNSVFFSASFFTVSCTWWIPNFIMNGSPLYTWQYLNLGSVIYPSESNDFWWWHQKDVSGLAQLISSYPSEFLYNFLKNLVIGAINLVSSFTSNQLLSVFVVVLYFLFLLRRGQFKNYIIFIWPVLVVSAVFVAVTSLAFNFKEALAPVVFLFLIVSLVFYCRDSNSGIHIIVVFSLMNVAFTSGYVNDFIVEEKTDGVQLTDLNEVNSILLSRKQDGEVLSSIHPARGYYSGMSWVMTPIGGDLGLCDFVDYNYPEKIINYAPKSPIDLNNFKIDYLIITSGMEKYHKFIDSSLMIKFEECQKYRFELLFRSDKTTLYKVSR